MGYDKRDPGKLPKSAHIQMFSAVSGKHTLPASCIASSHEGLKEWAKKIAYAILIFIGIQVFNQFLIFSGSALGRALDMQEPRFFVGVYQQLVQAMTGILLFRWIFKKDLDELGINTKNRAISLKYFCVYALLWFVVILLYVFGSFLFFPQNWAAMKAIELPQANTIVTTLLFQSFFPGMGEEILFRGFIIQLLMALVFTGHRESRISKIGIIALSSLYFAVAHIYFSLLPFRLTHLDYLQLVNALGSGILYAIMYLRTRSLLAPFLAHNFSNTTATLCGYIIAAL